ncbi:MAG: DUF2147 domain-containing protein [Gammaproteobacteria bacterium]|nr:DUF2147 domain-containing protein [Gammaproteobacteria bacterium]
MARILVFGLMWMTWAMPSAFAANGDDIVGTWVTQGGESNIEISRCQSKFCGKIVWIKNPHYPQDDARGMAGQTKVDRENPEVALRSRPLMGLTMLDGFVYAGENTWEDGKIYDPKTGKTYSCRMTLENNQLNVRGFIGFSLLGRTTVWTRK